MIFDIEYETMPREALESIQLKRLQTVLSHVYATVPFYKKKLDKLEPVVFKDFAKFGYSEKDLEELIAKSILGVLFEDASLMPIFQERQGQAKSRPARALA